jgi:DNA helicase HerA-like ATPase
MPDTFETRDETTLPLRDKAFGIVNSISGYSVSCFLTPPEGADSKSFAYRDASIGSIIKIATERGSTVFGFISSVELHLGQGGDRDSSFAVADIELFGELVQRKSGKKKFTRGVSIYPVLGAPAYVATHEDMAKIYVKPDTWHLEIGRLYQDAEQPAYLISQEFLCKHSAILGTTGSGKSCAVTLILRSLLGAHPNGHIVMIDPHGEYAHAFRGMAEVITPQNLQLPYWLLNFDELCEVLCSKDEINRAREAGILKEVVVAAKRDYLRDDPDAPNITADTPVPFSLTTVLKRISERMGKLDRPDNTLPYLRLSSTIEAFQADRRYAFMFSTGVALRDTMSQIVSRLLRIPVQGKPVTILDLSAIPSEIIDVVVSLLCRLVFDFSVWSRREESIPVLLVCDEAHRYVPSDDTPGFGPTRVAISRIAKEGRKYGVSLCLVSQRPSEISETVLSQCSTVFALRMASEKDLKFVRGALPEAASALINTLPALRYQEAVVIGEGVTHPMRIRFLDLAEEWRPLSSSANFPKAWEADTESNGFVSEVVDRWRRQER